MEGEKTMPTLRLEVVVKAMLTKATALVPTKVRTRETQGEKESFFNEARAESFKLFSHANPSRNIHTTQKVKLSGRTGVF